jgi:hypothetical protein
MDEELNRFLFGLIILLLIINTTQIWSLSSTVYGQNPAQQTISPLVSGPSAAPSDGETGSGTEHPGPTPTVIPSTTPAQNAMSGTEQPGPTPTVIPSTAPTQNAMSSQDIISPYVTLEQRPLGQDIKRTSIFYEQEKIGSSEGNFITIYSINNESLSPTSMPSVSFPLVNPPLILDYIVFPVNITDTKYIEYKVLSTQFNEAINITRVYEESWFQVTVRDKDTNEIVFDEGYGKTNAMISPNRLAVQKSGNYIFEFSGDYAKVSLTMKVKKEGNLP